MEDTFISPEERSLHSVLFGDITCLEVASVHRTVPCHRIGLFRSEIAIEGWILSGINITLYVCFCLLRTLPCFEICSSSLSSYLSKSTSTKAPG